jgi:hypothetical protein
MTLLMPAVMRWLASRGWARPFAGLLSARGGELSQAAVLLAF